MKIVMLGWEYPPHISGGLGTACEGLTRSLSQYDLDLIFVVPHLFGGENATHMKLVNASGENAPLTTSGAESTQVTQSRRVRKTIQIPSFLAPYHSPESYDRWIHELREQRAARAALSLDTAAPMVALKPFDRYGGDIFEEVARYAEEVVDTLRDQEFDVIHAHDWLTFPAGIALAALTKKPLIVHIHSLEFDRSGSSVNQRIDEIERWGTRVADRVIAVSYYTKSVMERLHGIAPEKVGVVHNGVYAPQLVKQYRSEQAHASKIVLFLGRITFQKGPDYLVEAAAKVAPHMPDVLFVMAGAGDMLPQLKARIKELGIEKNFYFPGFLRGREVEQMFSLADVYVMPSVSEPFGISALEAISCNTPVIISRQSGVAEVLGHALKVDFWDIEKLADMIINALIHEELRSDMISMAREEVKRVHWDAAAQKVIEYYQELLS
jgi:glycogen(starch) synthase